MGIRQQGNQHTECTIIPWIIIGHLGFATLLLIP